MNPAELHAEVGSLREQLEDYKRGSDALRAEMEAQEYAARLEYERLGQENDKLRAALTEIEVGSDLGHSAAELSNMARQALANDPR